MSSRLVQHTATALLVALSCALSVPIANAEEKKGGEFGLLGGFLAADEDIVGESNPSPELAIGLRGGSSFARRWTWFADGLYSNVGTSAGLGDARTIWGRTGFDLMFNPEAKWRWFASGGAGWMVVDFENASFEDFHRPLASVGFGLDLRLSGIKRLRFEVREDLTLDDARLNGADVLQGQFLVGLIWGPGTRDGKSAPEPRTRKAPKVPVQESPAKDDDGDGVLNRRDRCPGSPPGAIVDERGCSRDSDRDGVADGVDRCPGTPPAMPVDARGCLPDGDGDGIQDESDACADTPAGATIDEWGCPRDNDRDGVLAGIDRCPGTPLGALVDGEGCPSDSDGDGVYDGIDRCPDTVQGMAVNSRGCPVDSDRDGVDDAADRCPETPSGTPVDARGCPVDGDADGDGIADSRDQCPGTPRGTRIDAKGCPPATADPILPEGGAALVLEGVGFETNSATLTRRSLEVLDRVNRSLAERPEVRIEIGGHTDSSGSPGYNLKLSARRAEAIRNYLIRSGTDSTRLFIRGYGETRPVADNATPEGRARNRRVELRRLGS